MSEENKVVEEEVVDRGDDILAEVEEEVEEIVAEEEEVVDEDYDEEEDEPKAKKEPMLPKSRYDSVAAKNRELEARIAEMEAAGKAKQVAQQREEQTNEMEDLISRLDADYAEAVKDGDTEAMSRIRKEQRAAEREMYRMEMQESDQRSVSQAQEQVRLDLTIDAIEQQYEQLNPESDNYAQNIVDQIQELRSGFEATGRYTPTQALVRAVKFVLPDNPVAAAQAAPQAKPKGNLSKKVAAANAQPPSMDGVGDQGNSGGKTTVDPNPLEMTEDDWAALPESTLKRMRGDAY
jgi:myosin heavy subunit